MKSPEEIAKLAEQATGRKERIMINNLYRLQDESYLFPINGRFNATERAIRRAQKYERESGCALVGLEYCYFLDNEISNIVNNI